MLQNIYSIAVLNELISEVQTYKKEQNIQQISSFNKQIHDVVVAQPSAFIYERIGERYNHFLIDEFQDTSILQWQNMLPLITDAIDFGKSLVVGDGKQSIYRWRAGEVEQFLQLPSIFKGEKLQLKPDWENKLKGGSVSQTDILLLIIKVHLDNHQNHLILCLYINFMISFLLLKIWKRILEAKRKSLNLTMIFLNN